MISSPLKQRELYKLCRILIFLLKNNEINAASCRERPTFSFPPFELDTATHSPSYKVVAVFLSLVQIIGKAAVSAQRNNCVFNARRARLLTGGTMESRP